MVKMELVKRKFLKFTVKSETFTNYFVVFVADDLFGFNRFVAVAEGHDSDTFAFFDHMGSSSVHDDAS